MRSNDLRIMFVFVMGFILSACHEPYGESHYHDRSYVDNGEYKNINYIFEPYETYRVELVTYTGDADIAIYNEYGDLVVFSEEYSDNVDEVIFTAGHGSYDVVIYGNNYSEYELFIDRLPYDNTGLSVDMDGVEFNIDPGTFTGEIFSTLATKSFNVSHAYDTVTIRAQPDSAWLDITPEGTLYHSDYSGEALITIGILETESPALNNFASVMVRAEDYLGKVNVFREIDVVYRLVN